MIAYMQRLFIMVLVGVALIGAASTAVAKPGDEKRIALVIGNSAYQGVPPLKNPKNDASDITKKLEELNFEVITLIDADANQHRNAIQIFKQQFKDADVGLFFYAGHGIAINGTNYMIPVDARMASAGAIGDELVRVDSVVQEVGNTNGKMLVFLDACRENPFTQKAMAIGANGVGRGLAITQKLDKVAQKGLSRLDSGNRNLLVAFATQPGNIAEDGQGRNSPFTKGLLANINEKTDIRQVLSKVRASVGKDTSFKQVPWDQASLLDDVYLAGKPSFKPNLVEIGEVSGYSSDWNLARVKLINRGSAWSTPPRRGSPFPFRYRVVTCWRGASPTGPRSDTC
ncbi:MAG: caspase family protein [Alphaproteobacteria bacterium]|nr:caspase family protein [Alphaproteobacteria bacterium]